MSKLKPFDLEAARRGDPVVEVEFRDQSLIQHPIKEIMFCYFNTKKDTLIATINDNDEYKFYFKNGENCNNSPTTLMMAPNLPKKLFIAIGNLQMISNDKPAFLTSSAYLCKADASNAFKNTYRNTEYFVVEIEAGIES